MSWSEMHHYILDASGEPVPCADLGVWAEFFATADRSIARHEANDTLVSTVFLGLDHNFTGVGPPLLYETMIFGGEHDGWCRRATTRTQALMIHEEAMELSSQHTRRLAIDLSARMALDFKK